MMTAILIISLLLSVSCSPPVGSDSNMSSIGLNVNSTNKNIQITSYCLYIRPKDDLKLSEELQKRAIIGSDCSATDASYTAFGSESSSTLQNSIPAIGEYKLDLYLKCKKGDAKEKLCYKTQESYSFNTLDKDKKPIKEVKTDGSNGNKKLVLIAVFADTGVKTTSDTPPTVINPSTSDSNNNSNDNNNNNQTSTTPTTSTTVTKADSFDIIVEATIVEPSN